MKTTLKKNIFRTSEWILYNYIKELYNLLLHTQKIKLKSIKHVSIHNKKKSSTTNLIAKIKQKSLSLSFDLLVEEVYTPRSSKSGTPRSKKSASPPHTPVHVSEPHTPERDSEPRTPEPGRFPALCLFVVTAQKIPHWT